MQTSETAAPEPQSTYTAAIEARNVLKVYPPSTRAVDNVTFSVREGEIFGLLGPNGAGKTTMIKMITSLTKPTSGALKVFGVDVETHSDTVRSMLGYVPQSVSVDTDLSAYENLLIFAKLFYVSRADRKVRIAEALDYMGLASRANDLVKHYSGGMMRRLEIAQTLVNRPRILFLDEPSIGLDPNSRRDVWESISQLRELYNTTIFITTHDMSEADTLCDRVAIMDEGRIAALGPPDSLKKSVGGDLVTVTLLPSDVPLPAIPQEIGKVSSREGDTLELITENGDEAVPRIVNLLTGQGVRIQSISTRRPGLDDVFMKYTKRRLNVEAVTDARAARRSFARHSG
jgi:ABC-2 type transport system ATP-binding protein